MGAVFKSRDKGKNPITFISDNYTLAYPHSFFQVRHLFLKLVIQDVMAPPSAAANLRRVLEDPSGLVVAPGVYDGMSARLALAAGFDALYMVSSWW